MSRKNGSVDSVDKRLEGGGPMQVAEKDPLHNIDLDLMNALKQAYEEAVKDGFKGDQEEWQEMEEEAYREEENHCKQLESDFKLDFYPEEDTL